MTLQSTWRRSLLAAVASCLAPQLLFAQPRLQLPGSGSAAGEIELVAEAPGKVAAATEVAQPPTLDGNVLNDPAWRGVVPLSGFIQSAPDEGQPATERTEVRVVFTEDTIYFGVICYDADPSGIIMTDSRRDSSMNTADSFQMILDTFSDRQNGFVFGTTPAGQEYDGQVTDGAAAAVCSEEEEAAASHGAAAAAST